MPSNVMSELEYSVITSDLMKSFDCTNLTFFPFPHSDYMAHHLFFIHKVEHHILTHYVRTGGQTTVVIMW